MNPMLSPKQQEIRDRELAILQVAGPMLIAEGYHGLSMDRIAAELRYAKGTIYNHFRNKEEIILALALKAVQRRQSMFDRASLMRGSSRDRIQAIGVAFEIYVRLYASDFTMEQIIRNEMIWEKTSPKNREMLQDWEQQCMAMIAGIVRDGIASGDLEKSERQDIPELIFGLWALTYGSFVINQTSPSLAKMGITDVYQSIRVNAHRMLNGIPWHPIRSLDEDLLLFERIAQTVFSEELAQLQQL